jgi:dTDP-4-dehydrorhamnose reductase
MKIFIVGNKGQLGTDCSLVLSDHELRGADLPELDASDREQCHKALAEFQPEVVVNCAAFTAVDACETEIEAAKKANADAPRWMAEWCRDNDAFLVHVSTDYVFGGDRELYQSYSESDETGPVSEYGRTKLAGEQAIAEVFENFAILRTAWLYGMNGKNFLRTMLNLSRDGRSLKVVSDQFGSPTWSYTLARQIKEVAEARATGVFHATSEGYCSWCDLACTFLDMMGQAHDISPCGTEEYPTPAKRPANSILENERLKDQNLNLFRDWKQELKAFVEAVKENNAW